MKRTLEMGLGLLALAGISLPASAADLRPMAPPPPIVSDWSGFYLGVGLGGRWTETDWTTTCLIPVAGTCANAAFPGQFANDNPSAFDSAGFRVSGYAGYNWQFNNFVLGLEADFAWADNEETHNGIPGTFLPVFAAAVQDTATVTDVWDASIRGRAGFLVTPAALLYVTGGASWIEKELTATCSANTPFPVGWCAFVPNTQTASRTYFGWTVGAGAEWKFGQNWIARAEYRYSDYTDDTATFRFLNGVNDTFDFQVEQTTHTAYVGLSYLFK
jgi:outer membrane immunogenic protein